MFFSRRHLYCQRIDVIYPYFVLPVIIRIRFLYFLSVSLSFCRAALLTAKQMFDKANFSPEILCRVGVPLKWPSSSKLIRKIHSTDVLTFRICHHSFMNAINLNALFKSYSKCRIFQIRHFPPISVLLKLTCLVTLFDRKLQFFKKSPKLTIFGIFA